MRGYEIRFPGFDARSNLGPIRWELFLHRDVRDVVLERQLPTDSRLKIHRGGSAVDEARAAGRQDIAERIAELEALKKQRCPPSANA